MIYSTVVQGKDTTLSIIDTMCSALSVVSLNLSEALINGITTNNESVIIPNTAMWHLSDFTGKLLL